MQHHSPDRTFPSGRRRLPWRNSLSFSLALVLAMLALLASCSPLSTAAAQGMSDDEGISTSVVQQAAADGATRSITFLASGYREETAFLRDVATCCNALRNNSAGIVADPWPRYMPFINVYAVYERSPEEGASRPNGALHDCTWMKTCTGPAVVNNLGCEFGTPNPHLMNCDINKVVSLATAAPAQDIVVVLINADDPGGVATSGIAYITNDEEFMAYMLVHYLNRAVANLHEEYSLGLDTTEAGAARYVSPNCATSKQNAEEKWAYWLSSNTTSASLLNASSWQVEEPDFFPLAAQPIATVPVYSLDGSVASLLPPPLSSTTLGAGCSFGNFVAPSEDACMMRNSSLNYMCPVCREQLSRSFYVAGVNDSVLVSPSRAPLNLLSHRCPPENSIIYVDLNGTEGSSSSSLGTSSSSSSSSAGYVVVAPSLYLSLGTALNQNDMVIAWTLNDAVELAANTTTLALTAADMADWSFPASITATVADWSPYVGGERRGPVFTASTVFHVERRAADSPCSDADLPSCLSELQSEVSGLELCVERTGDTGEASANASYTAADVLGAPPGEIYSKPNIIIVACVTGGVGLVFLIVIFAVHCCVILRRPREVLNAQLLDRLILVFIVPCCVVNLVVAILVLVFAIAFIPEAFFAASQLLIAAVVLGGVVYLVAAFNLCAALFRWYEVCMTCCVLLYILAIGFFAMGIVALWASFNQQSSGLGNQFASFWTKTIAKDAAGNRYICSLQYHLACSGFHTGCFMTNSAQCPSDCGSNLYVNACQVPLLAFVGAKFYPVGVILVIGGFFFVATATLDSLFFMRYRQLSRTGRLRRGYRKDPHAPVVPLTHHECDKARQFFLQACSRSDDKLNDREAIAFLETVFGDKLDSAEKEAITAMRAVTFDEMMTIYFPYAVASATDPRALTPDEADEAGDMMDLQRKQYAKVQAYAAAAGPLSPQKLREIYQQHTEKRFMPQPSELLSAMREEAAKSPDGPLCRGLSNVELEGLRAAWVALHPNVSGNLTREEIRILYEWCHGTSLAADDDTGLAAWRDKLDVRGTGEIGWGEFCYPYAQRALLREARKYLAAEEKEVPPELLSRKSTTSKYGAAVVEQCFLPYEEEIPIERLVAFLLQQRLKGLETAAAGDGASTTAAAAAATASRSGATSEV